MLDLQHLADLLARDPSAFHSPVANFDLGGRPFDFAHRPALMGVINLSADSWYRESVSLSADAAIRRGLVLQAQGADLVDLGAESSLAHATRADHALQNSKLLPVVRALRHAGVLVSVETYDLTVAQACLEAGANVLNLTGTAHAPEIYRLASDHRAAVIICFVQGPNVREVGDLDLGQDPVGQLYDWFARQVDLARQAGLHRIFLDPGLGFYYRNLQDSALRVRHQIDVFLNTFRLRPLGCPICHALPHAFEYFEDEVRCAEPFFAVLAALGGANLFRTHELPRTRAVLQTLGLVQSFA